MSDISNERPTPLWILCCFLIVSGACALTFQVVWIRELRLVFGATTSASAAVLAIFMAGLGLGNGLLAKRIDRSDAPLRLYAKLEMGIAILAAASPLLIEFTRSFYVSLGGQAALGLGPATVIRLLAAATVLAIPTFLMGGTMPAAARAVSADDDPRRRGIALLYGLNTLGAVLGASLANFVLIEWLGNRGVLWTACALNLAMAGAAFAVSRWLLSDQTGKLAGPTDERATDESGGVGGVAQFPEICAASAVVGFVFFLMEIVWYRMLGPLLGGTTYTFGLILCVALLGIGVGGTLYHLLSRRLRPSLQLLSVTCALEALLIAIPYWHGDRTAMWVLSQQELGVGSFAEQVGNWLYVALFVVFPAALVAGFQFPLMIATAGRGRDHVAQHVGWTFASNTAGGIGGSLAGGFLLLPMLSAPGVWRLAPAMLVLSAIALAIRADERTFRWMAVSMGLGLLTIVAIVAEGPTAAWRHAGIGAGRASLSATGGNAIQEFINSKRRQCIWEAEGIESSVAITATDGLAFIVNGKSDGNAYGDAGTQIGLGLIGPLLHTEAKEGLVIGLGTGESAGWMADVDSIESVDVVELEPAVVQMAERCNALNRDAINNAKIHLHYNDAREFLLTRGKTYDLIVSEPSNPYRAGVANLYTQRFYRSAANRLNDDGLFLQWLQGYEVDERTVRIVLNTVTSVFPKVEIWRTKARDMVLVCAKTENALDYDLALLEQRLRQPTISEGLGSAWRVSDVAGILSHFVAGPSTLQSWIGNDKPPLNRDDRNLLEYAFAKTVGTKTRFSIDSLHQRAVDGGDDLPFATTESQKQSIARRKLAMHLHLGGLIPDLAPSLGKADPPHATLAEAYRLYLTKRYREGSKLLAAVEFDSACPIERLVRAHLMAEQGTTIPATLMAELDRGNPAEAAAVGAIAALRRGDRAIGLQKVLAAFDALREEPWGSAQLFDAMLQYAVAMATHERIAAEQLFAATVRPFAAHRLEERRLLARYVISENLDRASAISSLADLEPHVPWREWFLEDRSRIYADHGHDLYPRARDDLRRFRAWDLQRARQSRPR